jgi:hypothetical protein
LLTVRSRWTPTPSLGLAPLRIGGHISGTRHAPRSQPQALERSFEFTPLPRIITLGHLPQRLPPLQKLLGLLGSPPERVEHVGTAGREAVTEVRQRQIGRIAGMREILIRPLRFPRTDGAVGWKTTLGPTERSSRRRTSGIAFFTSFSSRCRVFVAGGLLPCSLLPGGIALGSIRCLF